MLIIPEKLSIAALSKYGLYGPELINYVVIFLAFSVFTFLLVEAALLGANASFKGYDPEAPPTRIVVLKSISIFAKLLLFAAIAANLLLIGYCYEGIANAVLEVDFDFYEPFVDATICGRILADNYSNLEAAKLVYGHTGYGLLMLCMTIIITSTSLYYHLSNALYEGNKYYYVPHQEDDITKLLLGLPLACIAGSGFACFMFVGYSVYVANNLLC